MLTGYRGIVRRGTAPEIQMVLLSHKDLNFCLGVAETQRLDSDMSAAEPTEVFVGMLSTTDSLQEGQMGMYLVHIQVKLQEQRVTCQGLGRKQRPEELNLIPVNLSQWVSVEPEDVDRNLVS